jgi:hypothetical protein
MHFAARVSSSFSTSAVLAGLLVLGAAACAAPVAADGAAASAGEAASTLGVVTRLDVTEGAVDGGARGRFQVAASEDAVRAVALDDVGAPLTARVASLEATYHGETTTTSTLGSGMVRVQYGLKLLHKDPCNLLYAMVRIDRATGRARLVVQTKLNPGATTSGDCGNGGYTDVGALDLGAIDEGERHTLRATWNPATRTMAIDFDHGTPLHVTLDAAVVARLGHGVGIRSDNATWDFVLATST